MEIEVKFYLANLEAYRRRLETLGARLVQPRQHELNLRFDTLDGSLARSQQVLRLRLDASAHLTYKSPGELADGVRTRAEIEFGVDDFAAARAFLEALGYQVVLVYEKRRAVYDLNGLLVSLDEMPYGNFTEIEGPDAGNIRAAAGRLGLDWEASIPGTYTSLFAGLKQSLGLEFRDLTFENFTNVEVSAAALGVRAADQ
jgi:adenylate cyclase class 2